MGMGWSYKKCCTLASGGDNGYKLGIIFKVKEDARMNSIGRESTNDWFRIFWVQRCFSIGRGFIIGPDGGED
jgi:hypothetical protein